MKHAWGQGGPRSESILEHALLECSLEVAA
jgi:hypothetical protein